MFVALSSGLLYNESALADGCPAPSFAAARTFDAGWKPVSLATGDFNGDGKMDVAVANYGAGTVSVLLGEGDGNFQGPISSISGGGYFPRSVVAGDFNGDGKLDLAVVNPGTPSSDYTNGSVSVLLGNGNGTFQIASNCGVGRIPLFAAVGDFNSDGKLDLAVANSGTNYVSVLLGKGDGTFLGATGYGAGANPQSVAAGDFNGDGKPDLAVANGGSSNISVLIGNGDGTFQTPTNYGAGYNPYSLAVGDLNGDGKLDLAVATFGDPYSIIPIGGTVSVLLGRDDGTFQGALNYGEGLGAQSVVLGDFNGDGKLDLAVANSGRHPINDANGIVSVRLGNGDATFQGAVNYSAGWAPAFLAVGDFDGDGKPDLAINSMGYGDLALEGGPVAVLLNTCASAGIRLTIVRSNAILNLSWPLPYTDFVLESATSFSSTEWQSVSESLATNNGCCEVTVPIGLDQGQRYFRLRKP